MILKPALVLLSLSTLTASKAVSRDKSKAYLRKLKKDNIRKNDQDLISTEVLKASVMKEYVLGMGDWVDSYNDTMSTQNSVNEPSAASFHEIDFGSELVRTHEVVAAIEDGIDSSGGINTVSPILAPESVDLDLNGFNPDVSESINMIGVNPVVLVESNAIDGAQEQAWNHGGTSVSATKSGTITFNIPETTHTGDTLFLFLSRTDGLLPINLPNWNRAAECFKSFNRQKSCMRAAHCIQRNGPYCNAFKKDGEISNGKDLATVVFYRHVEEDDPCEWTLNLAGGTTTWATIVSIPKVNRQQPIQRVAGTSCDRKKHSIFPSVYGDKGNIILLSQAFDDTANIGQFRPPQGTELIAWINDIDEAGFLYGKQLDESGLTGSLPTQGDGGPACKDALISLVVNID